MTKKDVFIILRVSKKLKANLLEKSKGQEVTLSFYVRNLLEDFIQNG